jgi:predicted nucleotidyltransferase component of viral defense system
MRFDAAELSNALSEGFDPATAEKVLRLLGVLRELQTLEETRDRLTLKGGTALNVYLSENVPRLSVDLDLMVTGFPQAVANSKELLGVVGLTERVVRGLGYRPSRAVTEAACTLQLAYKNHLGTPDRIKLDLDFLNRITLRPSEARQGPPMFRGDDFEFPVVSPAELLAQKLTAVAYRGVERDLFDMWRMLRLEWHTREGARRCYLAYSLLKDADWYRLDYPTRIELDYRAERLKDVLRAGDSPPALSEIRQLAMATLATGTPPFTAATKEEQSLRKRVLAGETLAFADLVGEDEPTRRTELSRHPGLSWRLQQVQRFRR